MTSPPKHYPPKRRALHERTDSHNNELNTPSVRLVQADSPHVYSSNPFPTRPSQILSPSYRLGLGYEENEASVSNKIISGKAFAPPKNRNRPGKGKGKLIAKAGGSTLDTGSSSTFDGSSSAPDHSPTITPVSSSPRRLRSSADLGTDLEERVSDEIIQLPSIQEPFISTCSASLPESPTLAPALTDITATDRMSSKPSEESISSSATTGTVQRTRPTDRPSRASYTAFPPLDRPSSSRSARSASAPFAPSNPAVNYSDDYLPSTSQGYSPPEGRRISSVPLQSDIQAAIDSGANVQYPIIRPPAVSGSWADTSINITKRTARTYERDAPRRWNPHLSTVHSESTDETGNERISYPAQYGEPGSINPSKAVEDQSEPSDALEPPRPLFPRNRDGTGSTIRVVNEDDDKPKDAQPQTLRSRASGVLSILSSSSVKRKSLKAGEVRTEPGSRGSFLRDSIPAWARIHYARGSQISFPSPPGSSEGTGVQPRNVSPVAENIPSTIHRPRNRPHDPDMPRRGSMEIAPAPQVEETVEVRGPPWRRLSDIWSPRLPHDKRPVGRSVWKAPSFDEKAENNPFSRRNMQILMFVAGFMLPFAWMIASFLPLPPRPAVGQEKHTGTPDVERAVAENLVPMDESRYQNARWWRNVNRIMSIVGFLLLATIIALAVVAARTQDL